ncbi:MAG: Slp family lipoprotein [Aeromonadaceae bacterium]|nr:Slp family lipoprotein [Aeromonadaceae bacterium]
MPKPWLILLALVWLTGCVSVPDALRYEPESALLAYSTVSQQPDAAKGQPVRWSGVIAATRVLAEQTELEVVLLPLKANGVPQQQEKSEGRFLARLPGLLDPSLYASGRSVTVLGTVAGTVNGKIGEQPYRFVLVAGSAHQLWPQVKDVEVRYVNPCFEPLWLSPRPRPVP